MPSPEMPEEKRVSSAPEKPVVMSGTRARAGVIRQRMSFVLVISTIGAFAIALTMDEARRIVINIAKLPRF